MKIHTFPSTSLLRLSHFLSFQAKEFKKSTMSVNTEFSNKRTKLKITVPVMRETAQVRPTIKIYSSRNGKWHAS